MEILIIGLLLVAAMVIVSTRIKRAAARAYEPETIEKEDFRIEKPSGFLYPLNSDSEFAFEAYSKEYGDKQTRNIWRARARLRVTEGLNIRKIINELESQNEKLISEKVLDDLPAWQIGSIVRTEKQDDEIEFKVFRKILANKRSNRTYELRTTILCPYDAELTETACLLMEGFELREE